MTHPLDKEFNLSDIDDSEAELLIPDDPTLDTIIEFALKAYKQQADDLHLIEPKNRVRYLEVSERFLGQAKDAIYKKDYLKLRREFLAKGAKLPTDGQLKSAVGDSGESQEGNNVVDRSELFKMVTR